MAVEVMGIDHIFLSVADLRRSVAFYDRVMPVLGFRKGSSGSATAPRIRYDNRQLSCWLRPLSEESSAKGTQLTMPHLCFRVVDERAVDRAAEELRAGGVDASDPRYYTEYAPDYYATFFLDPDGIRLEVMNFGERRRRRMHDWDAFSA